MFKMEFQTGNAAFDEAPGVEIARILREMAATIEAGGMNSGRIVDINGNTIGRFSFEQEG